MHPKFTDRTHVPMSPIRVILAQFLALDAQCIQEGSKRPDNLGIGQPHLPPHPEVIANLKAMEQNPNTFGYTPAQGEPETLDAIVRLYKNYYPRVTYTPAQVMATVGASGALSNAISIMVEKKEDIILCFEPYFAVYRSQIEGFGGTLQMIPTQHNQFRPDIPQLEAILQNKHKHIKAIILNYPNNPSGVSLDEDEVRALATTLKKFPDIYIIIDDVYRDLNFKKHITLLDLEPEFKDFEERCFVINSGAKGLLGAPAARIGMIAAPADCIKAMLPRQTHDLSSVPYATQAALRFAVSSYLNNPKNTWLLKSQDTYKTNVTFAARQLKQYGFSTLAESEGTFFLWVNASHLIGKKIPGKDQTPAKEIKTDMDIAEYLLYYARVAVIPGSAFGSSETMGYLRLSCAIDREKLGKALERIHTASLDLCERKLQAKL